MTIQRWRGDAAAISQVNTLTVGGTAATGQVYSVTMNIKVVSYTATGSDTNTTIATALQGLLAASLFPEFLEVTWANPSAGVITATANLAGVNFTNTSSATGTGTLVTATTTANSGPNDAAVVANWSSGTLPVSGDSLYFQNSSSPVLYNLDALAAITPALVQMDSSYTGQIGLPYNNANGYIEYRPRYLQFTGWTLGNIGLGAGNGSGKIQLDAGAGNHTTNIFNTASSASEQGLPCVLLKGGGSTTTVNIFKGSLGLALFAGETATIQTLDMGYVSNVAGDAQVSTGAGCTLTTVKKTGGNLYSLCAVPTLTSYAGVSSILSGNMTTLTLNKNSNGVANTVSYKPATGGTITTNTVESGCTLDCSGTLGTVILTNSTWNAGATINAPGGNITMTNAASIPDGQLSDVTINLGPGRHAQVT